MRMSLTKNEKIILETRCFFYDFHNICALIAYNKNEKKN